MPRPWNKGLRTLVAERLWAKVEAGAPDECWPFTGAWRSRFDYGRIRDGGGRGVQAHKAAYELLVGPGAGRDVAAERVRQPALLQPHHQRPGTAAENRRDQLEHGAFAKRAA